MSEKVVRASGRASPALGSPVPMELLTVAAQVLAQFVQGHYVAAADVSFTFSDQHIQLARFKVAKVVVPQPLERGANHVRCRRKAAGFHLVLNELLVFASEGEVHEQPPARSIPAAL